MPDAIQKQGIWSRVERECVQAVDRRQSSPMRGGANSRGSRRSARAPFRALSSGFSCSLFFVSPTPLKGLIQTCLTTYVLRLVVSVLPPSPAARDPAAPWEQERKLTLSFLPRAPTVSCHARYDTLGLCCATPIGAGTLVLHTGLSPEAARRSVASAPLRPTRELTSFLDFRTSPSLAVPAFAPSVSSARPHVR